MSIGINRTFTICCFRHWVITISLKLYAIDVNYNKSINQIRKYDYIIVLIIIVIQKYQVLHEFFKCCPGYLKNSQRMCETRTGCKSNVCKCDRPRSCLLPPPAAQIFWKSRLSKWARVHVACTRNRGRLEIEKKKDIAWQFCTYVSVQKHLFWGFSDFWF